MRFANVRYGIELQKDLLVACNVCGCEYAIDKSEVSRDEATMYAPMSERIEYTFQGECSCPKCGKYAIYTQSASEYPTGAIEYISEPELQGAELLSEPELDFDNYDDELYFSMESRITPNRETRPMPLELDRLQIDIYDGDAHVDNQLYIPAKQKKLWVNPAGRLLPILVDETGSIRFDENGAVFSEIIQSNPQIGTMRLLGKVAEAVIVRNCYDDSYINKKWLSKARKNNTQQFTADQYQAIGTGLHSTKKNYPQKYNPSDSQRDIIWIDKTGNGDCALVPSGRSIGGRIAGLQVKVSGNGINYVARALRDLRYEVPMVYFPMNDDYGTILRHVNRIETIVIPGEDFIDVREIDPSAFDEVADYYPILLAFFSGRLSVHSFIREAGQADPLRNGIMASALSVSKSDIRIIH